MPDRLRPTAPPAPQAILVGDPGRALFLAQTLLEQPKMSNHARGLWGYSGETAAGSRLTIQATGMGGPSAALVVADLAKLGVTRAVRIGTCAAFGGEARPGDLLLVTEAIAGGASAVSFGVAAGARVLPNPRLLEQLGRELGDEARAAAITSLDTLPAEDNVGSPDAAAADMQTVAVLARSQELGVAAASVLIVREAKNEILSDTELESAAEKAGRAAVSVLSNPQLKG